MDVATRHCRCCDVVLDDALRCCRCGVAATWIVRLAGEPVAIGFVGKRRPAILPALYRGLAELARARPLSEGHSLAVPRGLKG